MIIKHRNKSVQKFLEIVQNDLKSHNITLKFSKKKLDPKFEIRGYFDETSIVVYKNNYWLETLIHEYCHFLQWKNERKSYTRLSKPKYSPESYINRWLNRKVKTNRFLKNCFDLVRENEMDCELLSAKIIKKYKLPVNLNHHTQRSNLHILIYHCVENTRRWDANSLFYDKIPKTMPKRFQKRYTKKVPKKLLENALKYF